MLSALVQQVSDTLDRAHSLLCGHLAPSAPVTGHALDRLCRAEQLTRTGHQHATSLAGHTATSSGVRPGRGEHPDLCGRHRPPVGPVSRCGPAGEPHRPYHLRNHRRPVQGRHGGTERHHPVGTKSAAPRAARSHCAAPAAHHADPITRPRKRRQHRSAELRSGRPSHAAGSCPRYTTPTSTTGRLDHLVPATPRSVRVLPLFGALPDLNIGIYWSPTDDSGGSLP